MKNDDPQAAINNKPELTANGKTAAQNRWIAYNKLRGQYASAMEHAVPEQFWVDKSQCRYENEQGQIQNPTKADCAQAVSAVKAIAIAQAEGQRIYTINQSNAATALAKLPVGGTVGQEIQSAIQAGKEVTFHERGINAHGFSGYGYIITDPDTGGGAYLIEGKGNGGVLFVFFLAVLLALMSVVFTVLAGVAVTALTLPFAALLFFTACLVDPTSNLVFHTSLLAFGVNIMAFVMFTPALFLVPLLVSAVFLALAVYGLLKPNESRMTCRLIGLG